MLQRTNNGRETVQIWIGKNSSSAPSCQSAIEQQPTHSYPDEISNQEHAQG